MKIIEWSKDDVEGVVGMLDEISQVKRLQELLFADAIDFDEIKTDEAISLCKMELMGEYHCILVREEEEMLVDSEIYLVTYDGEASDGGLIHKLNYFNLQKIASGELFKN